MVLVSGEGAILGHVKGVVLELGVYDGFERGCVGSHGVSMHWEFMIDLKENVLVAMGVR